MLFTQGTARRAFFAVAGLPKPRKGRNHGGNAWDDSVVHSLPVVVVVDDLPKKAPALPRLPRMTSPILPPDPSHAGNLGSLVRYAFTTHSHCRPFIGGCIMPLSDYQTRQHAHE